jgi:hypothetical protein
MPLLTAEELHALSPAELEAHRREQAEAIEQSLRRRDELLRDHFQAAVSDTRWEANPLGLSGRVVRGYRHWRDKR